MTKTTERDPGSMERMCTCTDGACPNRIDKAGSCTRCVAKCLAQNEIPSCFFYKVASREEIGEDWSFSGFARVVSEKNGNGPKRQ